MLVLTRKSGDVIKLTGSVNGTITVKTKGSRVRVLLDLPSDVKVRRGELEAKK